MTKPGEDYISDAGTAGRELVTAGQEIAGSVAGAAAGALFGGPVGFVVGATVPVVAIRSLRWATNELAHRLATHRGRVRVGAAIAYATERIRKLEEEGVTIREDGFFEDHAPSGRNAGRELLEGVLLAARDAFEERKLRNFGYLFANAAYSELDSALVNYALRHAEALSWRQYVLLALVAENEHQPLPDGKIGDDPGAWEPWGARAELRTLYEQLVVGAPSARTKQYGWPIPNTTLQDLRLHREGTLLHALLSLDEVPDEEASVVRELLEQRSGGAS